MSRCSFGLHKWTNWGKPSNGIYQFQQRVCKLCNKIDERLI